MKKIDKNSDAYKKYVKPELERKKRFNKEKRSEWFWNKGLTIFNTLLSLIAAIASVIALLK